MLPQEVIKHKRDEKKLTTEEIGFFVKGVTDWSIPEGQIAAFTMAIFLRGMDTDETVALTKAMAESGETLDWTDAGLDGPVLDKHSTGGIGDSVSMILAPAVAACGGYVPMISGRGLGYTGGTVDKIESIPGYQIAPSPEKFKEITKKAGCAIIGQTGDLALADKRIYAVRDAAATIESVPLITASVLSKKLAEGLDGLVIELTCGNGAFMTDIESAKALAKLLVEVSAGVGVPARAVITDMNQVLGSAVGNAVEVLQAVDFLTGKKQNPRLKEAVLTIGSELLPIKGLAADADDARQKLERAFASGEAAERFARMVAESGGPADFTNDPEKHLPRAAVVRPVFAGTEGYVASIDAKAVGESLAILGGQRRDAGQLIDYAVGYTDFIAVGEYADKDRPIAVVRAETEDSFAQVEQALRSAIVLTDEKPEKAAAVTYGTVAGTSF